MGQYLSQPVTDKECVSGGDGRLQFGIAAQQGWRKSMEDAHVAEAVGNQGAFLFAVLDGHGGHEVAKFVAKFMPRELERLPEFKQGEYQESLVQVFHRMDSLMRTTDGFKELETLRRVTGVNGAGDLVGGKGAGGGKAGGSEDDDEEDTFDVLRKLVALQRMVGKGSGGGGEEGEGGSGGGEDEGDAQLGPEVHVQAGCTAVVALIKDDNLYVANAGDSRAVLCRGGAALPLSEDHKPSHASERARIMAAGGFLSEIGGITRVNGNLNLSRAIGDLRYKMNHQLPAAEQIITAEPDVQHLKLQPEDSFLILACDGIWDVMNNQQAVDFVRERLAQGKPPAECASELLNACLASDPREARGVGCDNQTACVVLFQQHQAAHQQQQQQQQPQPVGAAVAVAGPLAATAQQQQQQQQQGAQPMVEA